MDYKKAKEKGRKFLRKKMKKIFGDEFPIDWIDKTSFWDLEHDCNIRHYNLYDGTEGLWNNSRRRFEDNIRFLMKL